MRLIDADELVPDTEWDDYDDGFISYSQLQIDASPTIEPKKGTWTPIDCYTAQCTNCGLNHRTNGADLSSHAYVHKALFKFCPNCGADMRGTEDD